MAPGRSFFLSGPVSPDTTSWPAGLCRGSTGADNRHPKVPVGQRSDGAIRREVSSR